MTASGSGGGHLRRAQKLVLAALGIAALFALLIFDLVAFFALDFGAPTRPGWSTLLLIMIEIVVPTGVSLMMLTRATELVFSGRLGRAYLALGAALVVPIVGYLVALGLLIFGVIP